MRYSYKLSDALHIMTYIDLYPDGDLSSAAIANSIEANPSVVRGTMARLKKAGLLNNQPGVAKASLARPAEEISMLEVYQAIADNTDLLHVDPHTNPKCPVGANIQATLEEKYELIQQAAEAQMAQISLASISASLSKRAKLA
ncbi:Rrf2 family transcriptional regulator [Ligilactobacillus faecis]|uniref:Rrf2 family transcriptional regulator n=1 Tax=Ligilactobacillus faecis TaxID=762833 RepID=UPI002469B3E6|nr:Rrf2 family transcriptional regulator [Ligilactobacillus faecis]WGN90401.1 Rrf2 family transcriptional regulator [Ligilactobacillus faecis]